MTRIAETCARIVDPDASAARAARALLDTKTKPPGSLGRLEELACELAAIHGTALPPLPEKAIVVMGADHGVAQEGVSAYPQAVTGQMLLNFARGGAAINVLARLAGARVVVIDMGVCEPAPRAPEIERRRIGNGTRNITRGPAMTRAQAELAVETGIAIAAELAATGVTLIGVGEMGIANTTAASALVSLFADAAPERVTGRGTGIDDDALRRKTAVVRAALHHNAPTATDPIGALAAVGGFEIAGLTGVMLGAAARRIPVVVDGFICSAAALAAVRLAPRAAGYLVMAHRSAEPGHAIALAALGRTPLLDLGLRLGEGTGSALAMLLVEAALRILHEMATFTSAEVSGRDA